MFNHYFQNCNVVSVRDSAQHWLMVLIEKCCKALNKRGFAGLLLTDLSKAFDCIDHEFLIAKFHAYGFDIKSLELIHSCLHDRIQRVKINSLFSYWSNVESGIPQGSIKGPLLFNMYIWDLFFDVMEINIANYADHKMQISFLTGSQTTILKPTPGKLHQYSNATHYNKCKTWNK